MRYVRCPDALLSALQRLRSGSAAGNASPAGATVVLRQTDMRVPAPRTAVEQSPRVVERPAALQGLRKTAIAVGQPRQRINFGSATGRDGADRLPLILAPSFELRCVAVAIRVRHMHTPQAIDHAQVVMARLLGHSRVRHAHYYIFVQFACLSQSLADVAHLFAICRKPWRGVPRSHPCTGLSTATVGSYCRERDANKRSGAYQWLA